MILLGQEIGEIRGFQPRTNRRGAARPRACEQRTWFYSSCRPDGPRAVDGDTSDDVRRRPPKRIPPFRVSMRYSTHANILPEQWSSRLVRSAFRFELGPCLLVVRVPGTAIVCRQKYDAVI